MNSYDLTPEYLVAVEYRARKFSGAYTGTAGTLAADCLRLLALIQKQQKDLLNMETKAQETTEDVAEVGQTDSTWILQGEAELKRERRFVGAGLLAHETAAADPNPTQDALDTVTAVLRERSGNYGPPDEHFARTIGALNAIFAHKLREPFTVDDWPQIMLIDKIARNQGSAKISDTPLDAMGYSACWAVVQEKPH